MPGYVKNKGSILIVSLWVLMIIAFFCISLARQIKVDLRLTKFQQDKVKRLYIAKAAIQKVISVLENDSTPDTDSLSELWSIGYNADAADDQKYIFKDVAVGDGKFNISYIFEGQDGKDSICLYGVSDEERKININKADKELLSAMLDVMSVEDPESLTESMFYRRDRESEIRHELHYEDSQTQYRLDKVPFKAMEELILIKDFQDDPELMEKFQKVFTIYTKDSLVNINTAHPDILRAVFVSLGAEEIRAGLSDKLVRSIIDYRNGVDNEDATTDDAAINAQEIKGVLKSDLTDLAEIGWIDKQILPFVTKSDVFKVEVKAELHDSNMRNTVTAIIDRSSKPCKILYWHEK